MVDSILPAIRATLEAIRQQVDDYIVQQNFPVSLQD